MPTNIIDVERKNDMILMYDIPIVPNMITEKKHSKILKIPFGVLIQATYTHIPYI